MEKKWWEGISKFFCDYWWVIVIVLAVVLVLYFTKELWLPLLGLI